MSVLSYNQIIELFQEIANAHLQIQRFGTGELNEADLNKFISLNPNYPVFWATPIDVTSAPNTILYRFNLLFFDIVNKDKNNEQEVLSDTLQIALDVYRILKLEDTEFGVIGEPTISPFAGAYSEYVAGWSMEIAIEVDFQENLCDIPYEGLNLTQILREFTGESANGFGCDDLGTCIDIININTNIANLDANQITGGTYFSGTSTITLTNKSGGTIDITGITSTSTSFSCNDLLNCAVIANSLSGGSYSNGCLTLINNSGGTTQICGFITADTYTTGGTYTNGNIVFTRNDGQTYTVTGITSGSSSSDITVTGATYNNANTFTFTNNTGGTFDVSFNTVTGLTATTISATTYVNTVNNAGVLFGDGFDGDIILDGVNTYSPFISLSASTYTLTRNIHPNNLTINSGITLNTGAYVIVCKNIMSVSGTCGSVGNSGGTAVDNALCANYDVAGIGAASLKPNNTSTDQVLITANQAGANGNNGSSGWGAAGASIYVTYNYWGGLGGAGGRGRTGGGGYGGQSFVSLAASGKFQPFANFFPSTTNLYGVGVIVYVGTPGAGGGAGANLGSGWGGAGGGGGGAPFGVRIVASVLNIDSNGVILSNGGNGGNGSDGCGFNWTSGAGAGGGGGGIVHIITNNLLYTPNNNLQAKGGVGGLAGVVGQGTGAGLISENGANGSDGYVIIMDTSTGISTFYVGQH